MAEQLRKHGFDVTSTQDAILLSKPDDEQLAYAASQQRAIVTFNIRDFADLHEKYLADKKEHSGIIFLLENPSLYCFIGYYVYYILFLLKK